MANLLHKASIITTPTAYGVGVLNSIKPAIPFGEELISCGNFVCALPLANWTNNSDGTISVVNGKLKVLNVSGRGRAFRTITGLNAGSTYSFYVENTTGGSVTGFCHIDGNNNIPLNANYIFIASASSITLQVGVGNATPGDFTFFDNLTLRRKQDADFDFTRNSSATRVNPDYLIQDVSILSSNLVQNGNFSELGSQLITNGNFETDTNWTKGTGWTISGGKANCDGTQVSNSIFYQNIGNQSNKTVQFSFTISDYVSGVLETAFFGASGTIAETISANGNYTFYVAVQSGHNGNTGFTAKVGFIGSIDNVSVKQVDPNDNWSLGTGWSFGDGVANAESGSASKITQTNTLNGKKCKITFTVSNYGGSGLILVDFGSTTSSSITSNGTYTLFGTYDANNFEIFKTADFVGSVTDISLIEVQQTDIPRLDYTNGTASILLENQSTNLYIYSEPIVNEGPSSGITYESFNWSLGFSNCVKFGDNSQVSFRYGAIVSQGTEYALSAFVIMDDLSEPIIGGQSSGNDFAFVLGGSLANNTSPNVNMGYNVWRVSVTATSGSNTLNNGIIKYTTQSSKGFRVVGWQVEQQSYATSYIPTSGQSGGVTRAAETLNNAGNSDLINSTEGVLYVDIAALTDGGSNRVITLSDGSYDNSVRIQFYINTNEIEMRIVVGGVIQAIQRVAIANTLLFNKMAVKYKENDFQLWVNGSVLRFDTSGTVPASGTLSELSFDDGNGNGDFYGKVKTVAVFSESLSDTELACLTSTTDQEIFFNYYYRMQYVGADVSAIGCAERTYNI